MDEQNNTIAIIGAGLTGLTTAYYLQKTGKKVHIFEKQDKVGGVIQTESENGFIYEKGPNSGVMSYPEVAELIEDLTAHCTIENADNTAKKRLIWKGSRWYELPAGLIGGIKTPLFKWSDKFRILGEPFRAKGTDPNERLSDFVLRRLGKSFLDYAVDPFVLGIYAGDPSWLVPKYALPKLYNLEQKYGSFIKGSIQKAKEPKTERDKKATKNIFSIRNGLSGLINALRTEIGDENISLNCDQLSIDKTENGAYRILNGDQKLGIYKHVISTVGAHAIEKLFPFLPKEKTGKISCMKYAKVVQFSIGYNQWKGIAINAFGGLVPFKEGKNLLGVLFQSTIFKNRAPEGGAMFSVFVGGLRKPEMVEKSDEELLKIVAAEFTEMMGKDGFNPDLLKIHRYQHAIPQYGPESEAKMQAIEELESENPGLILAGNIRNGIGMADRIKQGREITEQLADN